MNRVGPLTPLPPSGRGPDTASRTPYLTLVLRTESAPHPAVHGRLPLEIVEARDCPVQVLERRTHLSRCREAGTEAADVSPAPVDVVDGEATLEGGDCGLILDVAFRNASPLTVIEARFRWEGRDPFGDLRFDRVLTFRSHVPPGSGARLPHETAADPVRGEGDYRLTVESIDFADGTRWTAPTGFEL